MTSFLLTRPLGTLTACLCLVMLGLFALFYMPINLYPQTQFPVLTISTAFSDSSPEEIETLITKPMEEAVADLPGLRKIQSLSHSGESEVTLQFHYGQNISEKALEVRSRIRRIFPLLPKDARFPVITRYDPSGAPVIVLAVTGKTSPEETGQWVYHTLKPKLSRIEGVATVKVSGAPRPQIMVDCDAGRLNALCLTIHDVTEAIRTGHNSLPAGFITTTGKRLSVVTAGKLDSPGDVEKQPVRASSTGAPITVGQLAGVKLGSEQAGDIARYNGQSLITAAVYRSTDADLRGLWKDLKKLLDEIHQGSDSVPEIKVITNQAADLETVLQRSRIVIAMTALITAGVLFTFLGNLRSTVVVLSAIPFSLCVAVLLMKAFGVTFDLLSLGGLTLGLGILVDNAIVVVESISRRWNERPVLSDAIISGTDEVALPLFLSTLSTVIVFIPVVFISREVRMLFVGFTWTVAASLMASLVASLVLVPVLFHYLGKKGAGERSERAFFKFSVISQRYGRILNVLGNHPGLLVGFAGIFLVLGLLSARGLSFRETLTTEVRHFRVFMVLAPGTSKETTAAKAEAVEKHLMDLPGVEGVYTEAQGNQGRFTVSMAPGTALGSRNPITTEEIKALFKDQQGIQFHVVPLGHRGDEAKLSLNIQGPSAERLMSLQDAARQSLHLVSGVKDVMVRQGNPSPVLEFPVRHEAVGFRGVQAKDLAYHLRGHLTGPVAAKLIGGERVTQVRVRALRNREEGLDAVGQGAIPNDRREMVPFMELAQPSPRLALGELHRENRRPVLRMTLLLDKDDPLQVAEGVKKSLDKMLQGSGCDYSFGDEIQDIIRTRKEMITAAGTGLALIYLILIIATESLLQPLLIMTAVPMGVAGAAIALRLLGIPVSLPVYVGLMILCGLIVNVNVVMTYTINRLFRQGASAEEAAKEGAQIRLRAILMTVLTTFFASLPMLLDRGAGSSMWSPFALTLAAGVISGALFSLTMTPILYPKLERLKIKFGKMEN